MTASDVLPGSLWGFSPSHGAPSTTRRSVGTKYGCARDASPCFDPEAAVRPAHSPLVPSQAPLPRESPPSRCGVSGTSSHFLLLNNPWRHCARSGTQRLTDLCDRATRARRSFDTTVTLDDSGTLSCIGEDSHPVHARLTRVLTATTPAAVPHHRAALVGVTAADATSAEPLSPLHARATSTGLVHKTPGGRRPADASPSPSPPMPPPPPPPPAPKVPSLSPLPSAIAAATLRPPPSLPRRGCFPRRVVGGGKRAQE